MNNIFGIYDGRIIADYHIHFGQFYDVYYQPAFVISALAANGVKEAWGSSTTACLRWNTPEEKQYILRHIEEEIKEALYAAKRYGINFVPLCRVIPQLYSEGVNINEIMESPFYKGFKVHPLDQGFEDDALIYSLMTEVCEYASKHKCPILIHTGEDTCVAPEKFEQFFDKFPTVKFVLAHCKEAGRVISLFQKFDNIFGDTAFCPYESFNKILEAGYATRMQLGTDFPITHWFNSDKKCKQVSKQTLMSNYKKVIDEFIVSHVQVIDR